MYKKIIMLKINFFIACHFFLFIRDAKRIECQLRYHIQYIELIFLTTVKLVSKKEKPVSLESEFL